MSLGHPGGTAFESVFAEVAEHLRTMPANTKISMIYTHDHFNKIWVHCEIVDANGTTKSSPCWYSFRYPDRRLTAKDLMEGCQ